MLEMQDLENRDMLATLHGTNIPVSDSALIENLASRFVSLPNKYVIFVESRNTYAGLDGYMAGRPGGPDLTKTLFIGRWLPNLQQEWVNTQAEVEAKLAYYKAEADHAATLPKPVSSRLAEALKSSKDNAMVGTNILNQQWQRSNAAMRAVLGR